MALERVPADIRRDGGVARMSDPEKITEIQEAVSIPVMAKCRIGHFAEAQILEALEVDYIDESEVLRPRTSRTTSTSGVHGPVRLRGDQPGRSVAPDLRGRSDDPHEGRGRDGRHRERRDAHARGLRRDPAAADDARGRAARRGQGHRAPYELVRWVAEHGRLPVVTFTAGGIATPADASLCMQLGADGVFVGSGIFKSDDPVVRAKAIVEATTHFDDPKVLADVSAGLGQPMVGIAASSLPEEERLEVRGW